MPVDWWRGVGRLYLVLAGLWMLGASLLAGPAVFESFRDGRVLRVAVACKAVQDEDFYSLPGEDQLKVYAVMCPDLAAAYTHLSFGARTRLSTGLYRGRGDADVVKEARHAGMRSAAILAGVAMGVPALGWALLLLARWIARGFMSEPAERRRVEPAREVDTMPDGDDDATRGDLRRRLTDQLAQTLETRVDRYLEVRHQGIVPSHHFAPASSECVELYRDGHSLSAVMVSQSVAEGIWRFFLERNGVAADRPLPELAPIVVGQGLVSQECADAFTRIWRSFRNDVHHMNPTVAAIPFQVLARARTSLIWRSSSASYLLSTAQKAVG